MDLKLSSWHLDPLMDALETDVAELASSTAAEQEPNARGIAMRHTSKSEELGYVIARLQAIGLNVGQG